MAALTPYLLLPGTAREALTFYARVFRCSAQMHTLEQFGRTDGPPGAIAHGFLADGPVTLYVADATGDQVPFTGDGILLSLLGTGTPADLRAWFGALAEGGRVVDDLQPRPWGATDGQVIDAYGVPWLIGYEGNGAA